MKKSINVKGSIARIVITLAFLLIIVYALKNLSLSIIGKKTEGFVTNTTQKYDYNKKSSSSRYRNTVSYYYFVNGKKIDSHMSYKTNRQLVEKDDNTEEKVVVQYLGFMPSISTIDKYNKGTVVNYIIWGALIVGCIAVIVKTFKNPPTKTEEVNA